MTLKSIACYFLLLGIISCKKEAPNAASNPFDAAGSIVKSYTYKELKVLLNQKDDKTYVVNFWATWCAPCVKELPAFEKLNGVYAAKGVEVLLVSLDFPKQLKKRVLPFLVEKKVQSKVILLDNGKDDSWIKAIDSSWSGDIPATLIYNKTARKFYKKSFDYEALEIELQTFLK